MHCHGMVNKKNTGGLKHLNMFDGKFPEIPSIGYLVMAEDRKIDVQKDRRKDRMDNAKSTSLPLQRGIIIHKHLPYGV